MLEKVTKKNTWIAKAFASPFILRILGHFTVEEVDHAVKADLNLVGWLGESVDVLKKLRVMLVAVPFKTRVIPHIGSDAWISWFINNELQHKRLDLYVLFAYNPDASAWLRRNLKELATFL